MMMSFTRIRVPKKKSGLEAKRKLDRFELKVEMELPDRDVQ